MYVYGSAMIQGVQFKLWHRTPSLHHSLVTARLPVTWEGPIVEEWNSWALCSSVPGAATQGEGSRSCWGWSGWSSKAKGNNQSSAQQTCLFWEQLSFVITELRKTPCVWWTYLHRFWCSRADRNDIDLKLITWHLIHLGKLLQSSVHLGGWRPENSQRWLWGISETELWFGLSLWVNVNLLLGAWKFVGHPKFRFPVPKCHRCLYLALSLFLVWRKQLFPLCQEPGHLSCLHGSVLYFSNLEPWLLSGHLHRAWIERNWDTSQKRKATWKCGCPQDCRPFLQLPTGRKEQKFPHELQTAIFQLHLCATLLQNC